MEILFSICITLIKKNVREILRLLGSIYTKTICRSPQTRETVPSMNYKLGPAAAI
jgi:hypothetical protein